MQTPPLDGLKRVAKTITASNFAVFCVLFLTGLSAYAPALYGNFIWDDSYLVGQNPFFKSPIFIFEVFKHYLYLDSFSVYYRPVQNISYMLDYWLWGQNPTGYHFSNVCYHVLTGFLLYLLLKALLPALLRPATESSSPDPGVFAALLISLVWVAHPIHNAAVAYVAGRADSLACIFAISAWLLYLRAARSTIPAVKWGLPVISLLFFLLGLCAKEIAFIWMLLFTFHLFAFSPGLQLRKKFTAVAAILAVLAFYVYLRARLGGGAPLGGEDVATFAARFMLMLRALGDYTWLIFYPDLLHMDRSVFVTATSSSMAAWEAGIRLEYLSVIGALTIMAFIVMCRSKLPGRPLRIIGVAWFLFGFLPISNLFPLNAQVAEHWIYMPSMGFMLFLAGCVFAIPKKYQAAVTTVIALAVIPLVVRTAFRSYDWADNERFYLQTIAAGSGSTRINLNLALLYQGRGENAKAEAMLRSIVKRFPDYMPAKLNLGVNLRTQGKEKEAEELFKYDKAASEKMAKQYTHTWTAALSLSEIRFGEGKHDESLALLDDAIRRNPEVWDLTLRKAQELEKLGRGRDAAKIVQAFTDAHWWHYGSCMMLAHLDLVNSETDAAVAAFHHAALLDIRAGEPYSKIAHTYLKIGRPLDAYEAQLKAVRREPKPTQYLFLATILDDLNRKDEAVSALKHAEELRKSAEAP